MAKQWDEIAGRWTRFSRDVKKKWDRLTDDEVMQINGRREILAGKIQEKYGITREKAEQEYNKRMDEYKAATKKTGVTTA